MCSAALVSVVKVSFPAAFAVKVIHCRWHALVQMHCACSYTKLCSWLLFRQLPYALLEAVWCSMTTLVTQVMQKLGMVATQLTPWQCSAAAGENSSC